MKKIASVVLIASLLLSLAGCAGSGSTSAPAASSGTSAAPAPAPAATPSPVPAASAAAASSPAPQSKAQVLLSAMSLDEKIGQLFLVRPDALEPTLTSEQINDAKNYGVTSMSEAMAAMLAQYPAGGIVFFGKNITSPSQLTAFVTSLRGASTQPLMLGIDEEGGSVSRIANTAGFDVKKYDSMAAVGATGDPQQAAEVGLTIGTYLKQYGFDLDFAPDADVNTNPDNIVIGKRAFGSDPALVARMVTAEIGGLHQAGVMTCAKHFPGHGDTKGDTHDGYVSVTKSWDELKCCELIPFAAAIDAGTDMVMAAHITARNVTDDGLPASLSHEMLTDRLRGEMGYQGVIITDAMAMGAIAKEYTPADAAVKAILAGADLVLMPQDYKEAFVGVRDAVQNGTISEERLEQSVLRVLQLKEKYGLLQ